MTSIDWGLLRPTDVGNAFQQGMEHGRGRARQQKVESALSAFAQNPDDAGAVNALMSVDFDKGVRAQEWQRKNQGYRRDDQFRSALGEYAGKGGFGHRVEGGATGTIFHNPNNGELPPSLSNEVTPARPPLQEDSGAKDRAFLRMWEADPVKAMEIDSKMRDQAVGRLKVANQAYGFAIQNLANVTDESSYQAVRNGFIKQLEPLGIDVAAQVPERYPGPDGVRSLLMRAVDAKDQIAALDRRDKLTADIADDAADNDRADRNTDSMIGSRNASTSQGWERVGIQREGMQRTDARGRRGQDIASGDRRRGQDITSSDRRYATDNRGSGGKVVSVRTPDEARKLPVGTKFRTPDGKMKVR